MAGRSAGAVAQPGASIGQDTYCPVSGVVFAVTADSTVRDVDGHRYFFCCAACAKHFDKHQAHVLASRSAWDDSATQ